VHIDDGQIELFFIIVFEAVQNVIVVLIKDAVQIELDAEGQLIVLGLITRLWCYSARPRIHEHLLAPQRIAQYLRHAALNEGELSTDAHLFDVW